MSDKCLQIEKARQRQIKRERNKNPVTGMRIRRNSKDTKHVNGESVTEFKDQWVMEVSRGRKCQVCRRHIYAGERSLRYMDRAKFTVGPNRTIGIHPERAICVECAKKGLTSLLDELSKPRNEEKYLRSYYKAHPDEKESEW